MIRPGFLTAILALVVTSPVPAQQAPRFRWQQGQVLTYRVEHVTTASETLEGKRVETTTNLNLVKRWQVLAVDAAGVATVQKSVLSMRLQTRGPSGDVLVFDSSNLEQSQPQMREQLSKYIGQPLETLRVDATGKVVEVKECKYGSPSRFECDLPFVFTLPDEGLREGLRWERAYHVTLEPPQGTGEKYAAAQQYVCKGVSGNLATVALTTALKAMPESVADRVPLLQMQPEGEVVFDVQAGLFRSARLRIDKELTGYEGENSSYRFQSTYTEEYVDGR
jgi:hypothetical protein